MLGDPKRLRTADGFGYLVSWKHRLRLQSDAQARAFVERVLEDPANVSTSPKMAHPTLSGVFSWSVSFNSH
jgi:hypothetical protein